MKRIYLYTFILFLLILFIPAFLSLGIRQISNSFQPSFDDSQKVYGNRDITQFITVDKDYFSGIGVSIRNLNLINKKDLQMSLYQDDKLIREVNINGQVIQDGRLVKFIFEPIQDSIGRTYKIVFSAENSKIDEALEIFMTKNFTGLPATIGDQVFSESISSVLFYQTKNPLSLSLSIYQSWFEKIFKDSLFAVFYIAILSLGFGYLLLKKS